MSDSSDFGRMLDAKLRPGENSRVTTPPSNPEVDAAAQQLLAELREHAGGPLDPTFWDDVPREIIQRAQAMHAPSESLARDELERVSRLNVAPADEQQRMLEGLQAQIAREIDRRDIDGLARVLDAAARQKRLGRLGHVPPAHLRGTF